ncbi:MAG TPA: MoaD/ThiS family protein [Thermoanaerobaculia bacterium]|nr:MoaD/ThiS family protein [Thermoanaerobaculia bacterium]
MRVRMLYFAVLRDIIGKSEADVTIPEGSRPADVWQMLRRDHGELADYEQPPLTAINESYAAADSVLRDGDELAFIPPVAGG